MALVDIHLNLDCNDMDLVATFWKEALGYCDHAEVGTYRSMLPPAQPDGGGVLPKLILQQVSEPPAGIKNRLHIDLIVGPGLEAEAERLVGLGGTRVSDEFRELGTAWIVMADPEGNEFCICEA